MGIIKTEQALWKIAIKEGISVEEVRRQIGIAIDLAQDNQDPKTQAFWNSIPHSGDKPTPDEVIEHIANIIEVAKT